MIQVDLSPMSDLYGSRSLQDRISKLSGCRTVVELGTGAGVTTQWLSRWITDGHIWTVDDGRDWELFEERASAHAGFEYRPYYADYLNAVLGHDRITIVSQGAARFRLGFEVDLVIVDHCGSLNLPGIRAKNWIIDGEVL